MAIDIYGYDLPDEPPAGEYVDPSGLDDDHDGRANNHDHGLYDLDWANDLDYCTDHIAAVIESGADVLLRRTDHSPWVIQLVAVKRR